MLWREMSIETYDNKIDALARSVYRALTEDRKIFLADPTEDCILTVNFLAALAEVQEVDQEAMASVFKETYQEINKAGNDSSDEGIVGHLTMLTRRREMLKEAEKKARAICSQANTKISKNKIYKNCSFLVNELVSGDNISTVVLGE